ncbi:uncharacterized protein LOC110931784 [Helianthus annuus]|uniref:uncharacterized protein LOC110931784 n=1 Tax=Helianthus annuus TaxID=4232 RepID=UPI000B9047AB|nr:uncharacterized protein LOC110931784 [Helianthus annuus]
MGQVFDVDLLPVTLGSFDVVIGMGWLSKHQAEILCKEKIVRIPLPSGESLSVQGHRSDAMVGIISAMKAQKCLRKGYPTILALVTDSQPEERKIEDLPVIRSGQIEALKEENIKAEYLWGMEKRLVERSDGIHYFMEWGVVRFGKREKLNPHYVGPFKILERIGKVAYKLELPADLGNVHDVFHVLQLKKCLSDETLIVPFQELKIDDRLLFVEEPMEIMDREVKMFVDVVFLFM